MSLVSPHKSLAEIYDELLRRQRQIIRAEEDGTAMCSRCDSEKTYHLSDGRCSVATGFGFVSVYADEKNKIKAAIMLIEELQEL